MSRKERIFQTLSAAGEADIISAFKVQSKMPGLCWYVTTEMLGTRAYSTAEVEAFCFAIEAVLRKNPDLIPS